MQFSGDLVTASPDVYQASLGPDSEFLLLASDGLWDYINRYCDTLAWLLGKNFSQLSYFLLNLFTRSHVQTFVTVNFSSDAVSFVRNQLRQHGDVQVYMA